MLLFFGKPKTSPEHIYLPNGPKSATVKEYLTQNNPNFLAYYLKMCLMNALEYIRKRSFKSKLHISYSFWQQHLQNINLIPIPNFTAIPTTKSTKFLAYYLKVCRTSGLGKRVRSSKVSLHWMSARQLCPPQLTGEHSWSLWFLLLEQLAFELSGVLDADCVLFWDYNNKTHHIGLILILKLWSDLPFQFCRKVKKKVSHEFSIPSTEMPNTLIYPNFKMFPIDLLLL